MKSIHENSIDSKSGWIQCHVSNEGCIGSPASAVRDWFRWSFIRHILSHHSDVIVSAMASQSPASRWFAPPFIQAQIKENIKAPRHWPFWGESTVNRWILLTKGPLTWKALPFDDVIIKWFLMFSQINFSIGTVDPLHLSPGKDCVTSII